MRLCANLLCFDLGVHLAQAAGMAGGYSIDGPLGGSAGRPVTMHGGSGQPDEGSAACAGKSAGDSCSFATPDGEGEVLIAGGEDQVGNPVNTAELHNLPSGAFTATTGTM